MLHVEFQQEANSVDSIKYGVKKVDCFWRDLSEMIKMHSGKIFQDEEDILTLKYYLEDIMVSRKIYLLLSSFCA